jgi:protein PsiE
MFRIVEDAILITIAILTVAAVIFELILVFDNQTVGLADLLLMFIYAEVFGMVSFFLS